MARSHAEIRAEAYEQGRADAIAQLTIGDVCTMLNDANTRIGERVTTLEDVQGTAYDAWNQADNLGLELGYDTVVSEIGS